MRPRGGSNRHRWMPEQWSGRPSGGQETEMFQDIAPMKGVHRSALVYNTEVTLRMGTDRGRSSKAKIPFPSVQQQPSQRHGCSSTDPPSGERFGPPAASRASCKTLDHPTWGSPTTSWKLRGHSRPLVEGKDSV